MHDPAAGALLQQGKQGLGQGDMAQVVHRELQLEALAAQGPGRCHHPGVIEQQIKALHLGGGPLHALQVRQVQFQRDQRSAGFRVQGRGCLVRLLQAAAGQQHGGALGGEGPRALEAEATVGAGDQGGPPPLIGDVSGGPGHGGVGHYGPNRLARSSSTVGPTQKLPGSEAAAWICSSASL